MLPGISTPSVNTGFEKNACLYVTDVVSNKGATSKMIKRNEGRHGAGGEGSHQHQGHEPWTSRCPAAT